MPSYPIEIRRCQHIKTSGAQCGSPALRNDKICFYHKQNGTVPAELYIDGDRYCDSQIMIPPFEDAHSIQMVLRHVVQLMLQKRINPKDAGLMLYALQIASGNLKQMQAEKPRPTQVVMDPEKVEDTPMGMTPWSASGQGHDPEDEEGEEAEPEAEQAGPTKLKAQNPPLPPPTAEELYDAITLEERQMFRKRCDKQGLIDAVELEGYLCSDGQDPLLLTMRRLCAKRDAKLQTDAQSAVPGDKQSVNAESENAETPIGSDAEREMGASPQGV
jgi:hypothetical protein